MLCGSVYEMNIAMSLTANLDFERINVLYLGIDPTYMVTLMQFLYDIKVKLEK